MKNKNCRSARGKPQKKKVRGIRQFPEPSNSKNNYLLNGNNHNTDLNHFSPFPFSPLECLVCNRKTLRARAGGFQLRDGSGRNFTICDNCPNPDTLPPSERLEYVNTINRTLSRIRAEVRYGNN